MSEEPSLEERVARLERGKPKPPRRGSNWVRAAATLIVVGLGCWFAWLVSDSLARRRAETKEHHFWLLCHSGTTASDRERAFVALVRDGNTEWRSAQLDHLDLHGAMLDNAILDEASFESTDLSEASFVRASLLNARGETTDFSNANLNRAQMDGATFLKASFKKANLLEANARGASFQQAHMDDANLNLVDLSDADLRMTDFSDADMTASNLSGADLTSAIMHRTTLTYVNLSNANTSNTDFTDSNWWKARGLNASQLETLIRNFPPSDEVDEETRLDYEAWLEARSNDLK